MCDEYPKNTVFYLPDIPAPWKIGKQLLGETNVLIGGCAGSGKSVLLNSIIYSLLADRFPTDEERGASLLLIDPKRVELAKYTGLPHTVGYASEPDEILHLLDCLIAVMDARYTDMAARGIVKWDRASIYLIIDELADLMIQRKKPFTDKLTRLMCLARAAGIHVIACTQSPARSVIPASAQINFSAAVALRCKSAIESRQIIGMKGAEKLPRYGTGLMLTADGLEEIRIPMTDDEDIQALIGYWCSYQRNEKSA